MRDGDKKRLRICMKTTRKVILIQREKMSEKKNRNEGKMRERWNLGRRIFSCCCRCNSFYFPSGNTIMDCGCDLVWCVYVCSLVADVFVL